MVILVVLLILYDRMNNSFLQYNHAQYKLKLQLLLVLECVLCYLHLYIPHDHIQYILFFLDLLKYKQELMFVPNQYNHGLFQILQYMVLILDYILNNKYHQYGLHAGNQLLNRCRQLEYEVIFLIPYIQYYHIFHILFQHNQFLYMMVHQL